MQATILLEHIKKHISLLARIIPTQFQVPVLQNVLIEAKKDGLYLSATDLEMGVIMKIPAKIEGEGATTVSGKHFTEIINSLTSARVTITLSESGLVLASDEGKVVLQTMAKEEFPQLFDNKGTHVYTFTPEELQNLFSKLIFAVSTEDSRPELTGIYMLQKESGIDFVATDGYRLSIKQISAKIILPEEKGMIVSARLLQEVLHLKDESIAMYVQEENNQIIFETTDSIVIGRLISGNFPDYERVIPTRSLTTVVVDREEFAKAVKVSSVFARESANIIRLKVEDKNILVFSKSSGIGEGEIKIATQQTGDNNEIAFNVKFLNDILRSVDDKEITMAINSATESATFKIQSDPEFLHIIMPVRVQE